MWWSTSTDLPVVAPALFNFMPSWWYREYGVAYGERIFADPAYRARTQREMRRLMHERLGGVGLGEADPALVYTVDDLENATMPAALGCEVVFADDKYPVSLPLGEDRIAALHAPADIAQCFPMREIIRQVREINTRYDQDLQPAWMYMGMQNIAVKVRGGDFFLDYYENPAQAARLLDLSRELIQASVGYFLRHGVRVENVWQPNCTVALIGPAGYARWLLPQDRALWRFAQEHDLPYAMHHCGHFDEYAALYRQVGSYSSIEIGWGSDLRLALNTFPEASIQYIIGQQFVREGPASTVREGMRALIEAAGQDIGRVSFNIADLEYGTPDDHVRAVIEALLQDAK